MMHRPMKGSRRHKVRDEQCAMSSVQRRTCPHRSSRVPISWRYLTPNSRAATRLMGSATSIRDPKVWPRPGRSTAFATECRTVSHMHNSEMHSRAPRRHAAACHVTRPNHGRHALALGQPCHVSFAHPRVTAQRLMCICLESSEECALLRSDCSICRVAGCRGAVVSIALRTSASSFAFIVPRCTSDVFE